MRQLPLIALVFVVVLFWLGNHLRGILVESDQEIARQSSILTVSAVAARMESERAHESWSRVLDDVSLGESTRVEVLDVSGQVLFATDPARIGARYRLTDPSCVVCHGRGVRRPTTETALVRNSSDERFQVFATPLRNSAACRRCHEEPGNKLGMVYVHQPLEPVYRQVRSIQLALGLAGLVALLLTVVTTRTLLGRYLGRPLRVLAAGAERIGSGDLGAKIELPERTELTLLADTFNNSAARLRETVKTLERQRDDFATLYGLVDQLSRAVSPGDRRRRCVELASEILKKDCALVRPERSTGSGLSQGSITLWSSGEGAAERPLTSAAVPGELPGYFSSVLVDRWSAGELEGAVESQDGAAIGYPVKRRGERLGLLVIPVGGVVGQGAAADPGMVAALLRHLGIALAYSDLQREMLAGERLAAIGETVAGIAHCLKNVLNGLRGGIYVADRALELEDEERFRTGWKMLKNNVSRVEKVTADMLSFVRTRRPSLKPGDPNPIVREVVEMLRDDAERKGVEFRTDLDDTLGGVPFDRTGLFRAVLNLATNAVDACLDSDGGNRVRIRTAALDDAVEISVRDNGDGIPEPVQRMLFTRLFTTKQSGGTGLGLPVTRKIIEEHGGSLTFDSAPGHGSTFRILLPFPTGPEAGNDPPGNQS